MKKLLVCLCMVLLLTSCFSEEESNPNELVILTSTGYEPYEMIDKHGNLYGFDIDFGNELGRRMGKDVVWEDASFDAVISYLATNKATMVIAGLSPDPNRNALFSEPYHNPTESAFYVITHKDNHINTINDLYGKTVGVQLATIQENAVKALEKEYQLKIDSRDTYAIMVQELLTKRIDFLVLEPAVAKSYLDSYPELTSFELNDPKLELISGICVGLPKESKLLPEVNKHIQEMKQDGTLDKLKGKWFK